ncbi:hypothetical protein G6L37_04890 [Agrobacterium rubi]|nr:hypothetical protein [Agrobacterium rubi]NTF24691.1 hypothetical protein [Agrobacterium rubi]
MNPYSEYYRSLHARTSNADLLPPGFKPPRWLFERMSIGFNDATKYDEFFNADNTDEISTFLREVIQNILDAGSETAHFAFRLIHKDQLSAIDFAEIEERAGSTEGPVDRAKIEAFADENGFVRCLEINDGGCGLGGPYLRAPRAGERPGGFQAFSGGFQNSSKINDHSGGSKGLGRSQIICASTLHTIAAYSRRADGVALAFALALLSFNRFKDVDYRPYGQFLIDNSQDESPSVPPLENQAAEAFLEALGSDRDPKAQGTCLILPSIRSDFTLESFMQRLLPDHIYTIMTGMLRIKVEENGVTHVIDKDSIFELAANPAFIDKSKMSGEELVSRLECLRKMLESRENPRDIGSVGRLDRASFPDELIEILGGELDAGQAVSVSAQFFPRERRRGDASELVEGRIVYTVINDPALESGFCVHVRDRLSTFTKAYKNGYAIMVSSIGDGVARMLRDSEDPSHTKWIASRAANIWPLNKCNQIVPSFNDGGKVFIDALTRRAAEMDSNGFSSLFSMPVAAGQRSVKGSGEDDGNRERAENSKVPQSVEDPDFFVVGMVPACGEEKPGFKIRLTDAARDICNGGDSSVVILQAAYAVSKGSPKWDKHSVADFDFDEFKFTSNHGRVRPVGPNSIEISNMRPDFELIGLGDFNQLRGVVFQYTKQAA